MAAASLKHPSARSTQRNAFIGRKKCNTMNLLAHFFINYLVAGAAFGLDQSAIPLILVFSLLPDLDHIPYIARNYGKILSTGKFGVELRTPFHELFGLCTVALALLVGSFFIDRLIVAIAAMCIILHYTLDFIIGVSRPLSPFSSDEVFLSYFRIRKVRIATEIVITVIAGWLFWLRI